jgi:uncharacterized protein (TIGR02145 family)
MKTTIYFSMTLLVITFSITLHSQSNMTIHGGGAVTVNGNTTIIPTGFQCGTPLTDSRDGKIYNTVMIGNQCWMKENMNIGTRIQGNSYQYNNGILEKYCYGNDENNCTIYGGLYQWDEAMQFASPPAIQGICPVGWHIPTDAEYSILEAFSGGNAFASGNMKETGTVHWLDPNTGATNSTGFTALPGGFNGREAPYFDGLQGLAFFWTSTPHANGTHAWLLKLYFSNSVLFPEWNLRSWGFSVRCLKD